MGKLTKKIIIYLDQNFISEISKKDLNPNVSDDYKKLFNLIHKGFLDEKLIVPKSFSQKIETSIAGILKERIGEYQSYMGQINLLHEYDIEYFQLIKAAKEFLNKEDNLEIESWREVYHENPDDRIKRFDIVIGGGSFLSNIIQDNYDKLSQIHTIQSYIKENNIKFKEQCHRQMDVIRKNFMYKERLAWLFEHDMNRVNEFVNSEYFEIDKYKIYSKIWAYLLVNYNSRPIKGSDIMDVEIISTYLPYVDVFTTDNFMANIIKELKLDKKYNTKIFSSKKKSRKTFIEYLSKVLVDIKPVNIPIVSIFVYSDEKIKKKSFEFFKVLGLMMADDNTGWVKIYAFDDGNMPSYYDERIKSAWLFYGLQEVYVVPINNNKAILDECRRKCRSKKFILIDSYRNIPENFKETLISYCNNNKDKILGYNIFNV